MTNITSISHQSFSALSPYLTTCLSGTRDPAVPDDNIRHHENLGYDPKYLKIPPLYSLPEGMPNLICQELRYIFFEVTALHLRHEDEYKIWWRRDGSMTCIDRRHLPAGFIEPRRVYQFLNKELIVYFETMSVSAYYSSKIARYIYREWLHLHNGRPPFQRDGFFAKAVQISKNGPQNLKQLSACHGRICQQLSDRLNDLVDFHPRTRPRTPPPRFFEPIHGKKIQSWRDSGYILRHLFRALYIVVDRKSLEESPEPDPIWQDHNTPTLYLEDVHNRDLARCTVLLVKTGDEAHLHSPISFLPLFDAGQALNVDRVDYHDNVEETVVRVKLDVAVRFVWELLCKEEGALDEVGQLAEGLRQEQDAFCEAWVVRVMGHSHRVGIDNNGYAWLAIRRALARMNNEAFEEDQVYPIWERIRHWIC
ncbi:uncharacterized protein NECHADRAFT_54457 [Fusarium vanettenii 77-13-4]|uniref:Uncharacterized protein n=1 Tax=Fusarium vanettenii (strain ATCC MYA-4622 / CBS 123669 / FGSC 9596 / NRRL 45880 / 77-13-4) TaxID=660122 RepID=C7ZN86_FUSV7|nr:uncharacterized protein NECHADRAFT_54457 [Fusarium vanettenii 77-13-4]EEU34514.1 hypothetical protein NECHADRAFT_54457 [Fusarium vanettenii 77-13-4]